MDARERALERLYRDRYVAFRNALATITGSYERLATRCRRPSPVRASFRGDGPLEAWVWRIALRVGIHQRGRPADAPLNGPLDPQLPEPHRDPDLAAALRSLPPRRRLVVFLRYFGDLSYAEIAGVCGVSEGTVAASLAQARAALRETLTREGALR